MSDAMEAGEALARVLESENAALAGMDFGGLAPLVAGKAEATARFARAVGEARQAAPQDGLAAFGALHDRLAGLLADNRRLLARSLAAQSELMEAIARRVAEADPPAGYGPPAPRRPAPLAVSARA